MINDGLVKTVFASMEAIFPNEPTTGQCIKDYYYYDHLYRLT